MLRMNDKNQKFIAFSVQELLQTNLQTRIPNDLFVCEMF